MKKQQIFDKVKALVAEYMDIDESNIKPESRFEADLGGDSLDMIEIMVEVEREFGISIPDEVYSGTNDFTVQEACDKIESFINKK